MVSKAREDLPEPETPVTTVRELCGTSKSMFLRLCTRAPRTMMLSLSVSLTCPATFSDTAILNLGRPVAGICLGRPLVLVKRGRARQLLPAYKAESLIVIGFRAKLLAMGQLAGERLSYWEFSASLLGTFFGGFR